MSDVPAPRLLKLARDCTDRARLDSERDNLPIIGLLGPSEECSRLLDELKSYPDWSGPRVVFDCHNLRPEFRPYQVANRLVFELGKRTHRFGKVRFPRLSLGMWAVRIPLDPNTEDR